MKFELIGQVAPAFVLGIYWKRLSRWPVFFGRLAGALLAGGMTVFEVSGPFGFSGGLLGLLLNVVICVVGSLLTPAPREEMEVAEQKTKIPV